MITHLRNQSPRDGLPGVTHSNGDNVAEISETSKNSLIRWLSEWPTTRKAGVAVGVIFLIGIMVQTPGIFARRRLAAEKGAPLTKGKCAKANDWLCCQTAQCCPVPTKCKNSAEKCAGELGCCCCSCKPVASLFGNIYGASYWTLSCLWDLTCCCGCNKKNEGRSCACRSDCEGRKSALKKGADYWCLENKNKCCCDCCSESCKWSGCEDNSFKKNEDQTLHEAVCGKGNCSTQAKHFGANVASSRVSCVAAWCSALWCTLGLASVPLAHIFMYGGNKSFDCQSIQSCECYKAKDWWLDYAPEECNCNASGTTWDGKDQIVIPYDNPLIVEIDESLNEELSKQNLENFTEDLKFQERFEKIADIESESYDGIKTKELYKTREDKFEKLLESYGVNTKDIDVEDYLVSRENLTVERIEMNTVRSDHLLEDQKQWAFKLTPDTPKGKTNVKDRTPFILANGRGSSVDNFWDQKPGKKLDVTDIPEYWKYDFYTMDYPGYSGSNPANQGTLPGYEDHILEDYNALFKRVHEENEDTPIALGGVSLGAGVVQGIADDLIKEEGNNISAEDIKGMMLINPFVTGEKAILSMPGAGIFKPFLSVGIHEDTLPLDDWDSLGRMERLATHGIRTIMFSATEDDVISSSQHRELFNAAAPESDAGDLLAAMEKVTEKNDQIRSFNDGDKILVQSEGDHKHFDMKRAVGEDDNVRNWFRTLGTPTGSEQEVSE